MTCPPWVHPTPSTPRCPPLSDSWKGLGKERGAHSGAVTSGPVKGWAKGPAQAHSCGTAAGAMSSAAHRILLTSLTPGFLSFADSTAGPALCAPSDSGDGEKTSVGAAYMAPLLLGFPVIAKTWKAARATGSSLGHGTQCLCIRSSLVLSLT